ncbi:MAG: hypothetical protein PWP04_1642 [Candidatus Atribacteria bacterium]|nr:hypothetical protein [Candidatus Atribacteria bacterium]
MKRKDSHQLRNLGVSWGLLLLSLISGLAFPSGGVAQSRVEIRGLNYPWMEEVVEVSLREAEYHFTRLTGFPSRGSWQLLLLPVESFYSNQQFPGWSAGVYQGNTVILPDPAILLKKGILIQTLKHEFLHALLGTSGLLLPLWLEEGMVGSVFPPSWPEEVDNSEVKEVKERYRGWVADFAVFKEKIGEEALPQFFSQVKAIGFEQVFSAWMKGKQTPPETY